MNWKSEVIYEDANSVTTRLYLNPSSDEKTGRGPDKNTSIKILKNEASNIEVKLYQVDKSVKDSINSSSDLTNFDITNFFKPSADESGNIKINLYTNGESGWNGACYILDIKSNYNNNAKKKSIGLSWTNDIDATRMEASLVYSDEDNISNNSLESLNNDSRISEKDLSKEIAVVKNNKQESRNIDGGFKIKKTDNNNKPLKGAEFTLYKVENGVVKNIVTTKSSDENGEINFSPIPEGEYRLEEVKAPEGYKKTHKQWNIVVNKDAKTFISEIGEVFSDEEASSTNRNVSKFIKLRGSINYKDIDLDNALSIGTAENNITINMNFDVNTKVNPGDYFVLEESDTLHYNMLNYDELNYPEIINNQGEVIAKRKLNSEFNFKKGTNKKIIYVFTDKVKNLEDIKMNLLWSHSVNVNVVNVYGTYDFNVKLDNQTISKYIYVKFKDISRGQDGLNLNSAYLYANDINKRYSQIAYINPDKNNITGKSIIYVYAEGDNNLANVDKDKIKITLYKFKNGAYPKQAVIFDENQLEKVDKSKYQLKFMNHYGQNRVEISLTNIGRDTYLIKADGEMSSPSTNKKLIQFIELKKPDIAGKNWVRRANGIMTNSSRAESRGSYINPVLKVENNKIPKVNVEFLKIGKINNEENPLQGANFRLKKIENTGFKEIKSNIVSNSEGKIILDNLEAGTYELEEISAPNGFEILKFPKTFTIDSNGIIKIKGENGLYENPSEENKKIVNIKKFNKKIRLKKIDGLNKKVLSGVEFSLEKINDIGNVYSFDTLTTDNNGLIEKNELENGLYILKEKKAKDGYKLLDREVRIHVTDDDINSNELNNGYSTIEDSEIIYNSNYKNFMNLKSNIISATDTKIVGRIYLNPSIGDLGMGPDKQTIFTINKGNAKDINAKVYQIDEAHKKDACDKNYDLSNRPSNSYGLKDNKVEFRLGSKGKERWSGKLFIVEITATFDKEVDKNLNYRWWLNGDNTSIGRNIGVKKLGESDKFYKIIKNKNANDLSIDIEVSNFKNSITFKKVDKETKNILEGVIFELRLEGDSNFKLEKTTDSKGEITFEELQPGKYKLHETKPKAGYILPQKEVSSFEVLSNGEIKDLEKLNTNIENEKNNIYFRKVDAVNNRKLKDAEFSLWKYSNNKFIGLDEKKNITTDSNKIFKIKSDKDGNFQFSGIESGVYALKEEKPSPGYKKPKEDFIYKFKVENGKIFKLEENGKRFGIEIKNSADNRIEITNERGIFPRTGGMGTFVFTLSGLTTMAVALYLNKKSDTVKSR